MDRDLIGATGQALALLAGVLQARGVMDAAEFARLLGLLAAVTAETSPAEGDCLGAWAGMIGDACSGGKRTTPLAQVDEA